jgi:hypothetical protein
MLDAASSRSVPDPARLDECEFGADTAGESV